MIHKNKYGMKIFKAVLVVFFLILFQSGLSGQKKPVKRNGIFAETYLIRHDFSDGAVSLNYERIMGKKQNKAFRLGFYPDFESTVSFPVTLTWLTTPSKNHHFEFGMGMVYRVEKYEGKVYKDFPAAMIPVVYRYQNSNFFLRGGMNVFVSWPTIPCPSFSAGFRF